MKGYDIKPINEFLYIPDSISKLYNLEETPFKIIKYNFLNQFALDYTLKLFKVSGMYIKCINKNYDSIRPIYLQKPDYTTIYNHSDDIAKINTISRRR